MAILSNDELKKVRTAGFILAVSYLRVEDLEKATIILEALFHLNPNDIEVNALLAHTYLKRGQASQALKMTTRLIKVKKINPAYFFLHAKALTMLDRKDEAEATVQLYIKYKKMNEEGKLTPKGALTI